MHKGNIMSTIKNKIKITKRTENSIINAITKGKSLRQIGEKYGISHQRVWRIGDSYGVYSVRSPYNT
jgi:transposase